MRKAEEATDALREAAYDTIKAADLAADALENGTRGAGMAEQASVLTYAAALKGAVPLAHLNTLARVKVRRRQILIDKDPGTELNPFKELTERELVAKVNEAVEYMDTLEEGEAPRFVGVKKLVNGGIVFDLETQEAAEVIQTRREDFLRKFSTSAVVKERSACVIMGYVPVSHAPDALAEYTRIEHNSGLPDGTLESTRWIKPVQRRSPGQWTGWLSHSGEKDVGQEDEEGTAKLVIVLVSALISLSIFGCGFVISVALTEDQAHRTTPHTFLNQPSSQPMADQLPDAYWDSLGDHGPFLRGLLSSQAQQLQQLQLQNQELHSQIVNVHDHLANAAVNAAVAAAQALAPSVPHSVPPSTRSIKAAEPEKFNGDRAETEGFIRYGECGTFRMIPKGANEVNFFLD
ncbi:hypothetical protein JB92DRAFT_3114809 [Gautieria morchelliformis]|nr:hypothetical protein JB92DRAFT_3114809 [Gautieria morchelliformis]